MIGHWIVGPEYNPITFLAEQREKKKKKREETNLNHLCPFQVFLLQCQSPKGEYSPKLGPSSLQGNFSLTSIVL